MDKHWYKHILKAKKRKVAKKELTLWRLRNAVIIYTFVKLVFT